MDNVDIFELVKNCDRLLVDDHTAPDNVLTTVVPANAIFNVIETAHRNQRKIVIQPVGKPIIDWR